MNEAILKALKALEANEAIYTSQEVGVTNRQIRYNSFDSDADAMAAASNFMVPMTDAEGNAYYEDLPSAIYELDSKGTLTLYKALYDAQFSDAKKRGELLLDITNLHPKFDAPEIGEYEVPSISGADEFTSRFQYLPVKEEAGSTEENDYTFAIPVSAEAVIAVNGKIHNMVELVSIDGTDLFGGVIFMGDVPKQGDTIIVIGDGVKGWSETCEKNIKRCDEQIQTLGEAQAENGKESEALITQLEDNNKKVGDSIKEADENAKALTAEAEASAKEAQDANSEAAAETAHKASVAAIVESFDHRRTEANLVGESDALKNAIDSSKANFAKSSAQSEKTQSEVNALQEEWQLIEKSLISWDEGNDKLDGVA